MKLIQMLFVFILLPAVALPAVIRVPEDQPAIQTAINVAAAGDLIIVKAGTYYENINFFGKAIVVRSDGDRDYLTRDLLPRKTVINGQQLASVVTFNTGEGPQSVLEGFIVTNGLSPDGGGVLIHHASPVVTGNIIMENAADNSGGGIHIFGVNSNPLIRNNTIKYNKAKAGGGIEIYDASPDRVINNVIKWNKAEYGGGMAVWSNAYPHVTNNTFFGNTAGSEGGGIWVVNASNLTLTNDILWKDSAPLGPEIHVDASSAVNVTCCDIAGGWPGVGNFSADPQFVDYAACDMHLFWGSPCRDVGTINPYVPTYDFEGDPRPFYQGVDIGADEFYYHLYYTGNATPGGTIVLKFVGLPGSNPVGFWISAGLIYPPIWIPPGFWHLDFTTLIGPIMMPPIPGNGVLAFAATFPAATPPGLLIYLQAWIGGTLTDYCSILIN